MQVIRNFQCRYQSLYYLFKLSSSTYELLVQVGAFRFLSIFLLKNGVKIHE